MAFSGKFCRELVLCFSLLSMNAGAATQDGDNDNQQSVLYSSGLAAALKAVMANHPALKGKQAEVEAAGHAVSSAKAARYPTLSAQANNLDDNNNQSIVRLQQPLWAFGRIDIGIEQAEASLNAEQQALFQIKRQLLEETAVAYARIQGIRKRQDVAHANITEHERLYQQIQRRHQGQLASETDVRLAYSRLLQAGSALQRLDGELRVALTDLRVLTQVPIAADEDIAPDLTRLPAALRVEQLALENHADLKLKQARVATARLAIQQEKAALLPTLSLQAEQDFSEGDVRSDQSRIGLVLEANLESLGFAASGRIKGAGARLDAARQDLDLTQNDVLHQVERLLLSRAVQNELRVSQQEMIRVIEGTAASFVRQYETGRKSWLDVLNTQRELADLHVEQEQMSSEELILSLRIAALIGHLDALAGVQPQ